MQTMSEDALIEKLQHDLADCERGEALQAILRHVNFSRLCNPSNKAQFTKELFGQLIKKATPEELRSFGPGLGELLEVGQENDHVKKTHKAQLAKVREEAKEPLSLEFMQELRVACELPVEQLESAISALRHVTSEYHRASPEQLPEFRLAFVRMGFLRMVQTLNEFGTSVWKGESTAEMSAQLQVLQLAAAFVAHSTNGGWAKSPEAYAIRGVAQFLRGNLAAACTDLSSSLAIGCNHWSDTAYQSLAATMLQTSRRGEDPCLGLWCPLDHASASQRFAAACCRHGSKLFVFGGLQPNDNRSHLLSPIVHAIHHAVDDSMISLCDLVTFDLDSGNSELLHGDRGSGRKPPGRGHAHMVIYEGSLWLAGGRQSYFRLAPALEDMWRFDLEYRRWKRIAGKHIKACSVPHCVWSGSWWFVIPEGNGPMATVSRFAFESRTWQHHVKVAGSSPSFADHPATGWLQSGRLFCWARMAEEDAWNMTAPLHVLDLEARCWSLLSVLGLRGEPFSGAVCPIFSEAASDYDEESQRAYVYGGWHDNLNLPTVSDACTPVLLMGRYSGILLEVDVSAMRLRAVEPSGQRTGPGFRALPAFAAHAGKIAVLGGYTTLNPVESYYDGIRLTTQGWMCRMRGGDSSQFDPIDVANSSRRCVVQVSEADIAENARRAVFHSDDLRRQLGEMTPADRRGVVAVLLVRADGAMPSVSDVFSEAAWHSVEELDTRYPSWRSEEHVWHDVQTYDPVAHILVAFILEVDGLHRFVSTARFARWRPGAMFCNEEELLKGRVVLSSSSPAPVQSLQSISSSSVSWQDVCANAACSTRSGKEVPQLKLCSRCKAVRYCSTECQRQDHKRHKAYCVPCQWREPRADT